MVDRFLGWKLPADFNPVGTNLLDATQATEMVRHLVEGLPADPVQPDPEIVGHVLMMRRLAEGLDIAFQNTSMVGRPDPRCIALARTKLEEAVMWAVKGLSGAEHG